LPFGEQFERQVKRQRDRAKQERRQHDQFVNAQRFGQYGKRRGDPEPKRWVNLDEAGVEINAVPHLSAQPHLPGSIVRDWNEQIERRYGDKRQPRPTV